MSDLVLSAAELVILFLIAASTCWTFVFVLDIQGRIIKIQKKLGVYEDKDEKDK